MEVKLNSTTESINRCIDFAAVIIVYLLVWRVVNYVWLRPRRLERQLRTQGFDGNPYRLWYGDLKDLNRMLAAAQSKPINVDDDILPYVLPFHHHIIQKYGKRCFMWNGPNPRILITDPNLIREVMQKYEVFRKMSINPLNRLLITGIVVREEEQWIKHRRILNPAFTVVKIKVMVPIMHISCGELVEKWQKMMSDKGSQEVDVWPYLTNLTADIISRTAFGSNYEQGKMIFQLQREQAKNVSKLNRSMYIPGWRFLPTKTNKRMKEIDRQVQAVMRGIIHRREEAMKAGENKANDLLGMLLESNSKEVEENGNRKEMGISIENVIEECKLFYFAGQETTSNLLVWTMVMLSIHQNWQIQAREEVLMVFGKNKPNFDGILHLKKVNMILHEVLRLYPPATMLIRATHEKIKLGDITLTPGMEILLPIILVHRDKELWGDDAKEFKPERFSQGVAKAAKSQFASFFPFGLGPRICIGQNFAMVEAKLALAMILQHFRFELSSSYEHAPVPVLTMQPKYGAKIMLHQI
ncbi:hypothetical protein BUALT_Bualt03G0155200 [Buddleja alternifolia]|uniref:Cytochrome P450 n=1 Tax=Buddleja alternifolia TaxID=168488 RepID=A0AAV6Y0P3_9LAMI|nr:hypothetical protein BUALT_Bualt03G0155200 [Buddleja alternifolia]